MLVVPKLGDPADSKALEVDAELGVSPLVLAEDLEQDLVGVDRDDRVEHDEGGRVVAEEPGEILPAGPARRSRFDDSRRIRW